MEINFNNIPDELKHHPHWVNWTIENRNGKLTKIPINPKTGGRAQSNNPSTWGTYDQASYRWKESENGGIEGIGLMFHDGYSGVDFDKCRNPQTAHIEPWAKEIIDRLSSYTEVTPSGAGLHTLTKGALPPGGRRKGNLEMYDKGRFFTITGWHLEGTPTTIEQREQVLKEVHQKYITPKNRSSTEKAKPQNNGTSSLSDLELIEKAKKASNGDKFQKLFAGDFSDYLSWSEADLALCSMLAFWTGNNPAQIDSIFRQSGLMRDKWDERHGDLTYGEMTINKAIQGTTETYTHDPSPSSLTDIQNTSVSEDEVLLQYHLTDVGNAESFHQLYGSEFLYAKEKKLWLHFDKVRWAEDEEAVKQAMIKTMRYKTEMALKIFPPNSEQMKKMVQWSLSSESNYKLSQALEIASIYVSKSINEFDTGPMLLACVNGVIDLQAGILRQATPKDMIQRSTNITFDPKAQCIRWQQFLLEVFQGDMEMIDFVQRAIGYTLTGLTKEQCLFLLYGVGANGKTTFLEILQKIMGEYGLAARFETFRDRKYEGIPTEIARMAGARFVKSIETKEGAKINEERIKVLTGGDKISARFLYGREFDFYPICKIWIAVNHKPRVTDTTISYWRRMREIDFEVNFESREDKELPQKLESELPGILTWCVQGCLNYQRRGLEPIEKIKKATAQYRYDSDVLNQFIDQKLVIDRSKEIQASGLYEAYKQWCRDNEEYLMTSTMFGKRMVEKGFSKNPRGSYIFYRGIELR